MNRRNALINQPHTIAGFALGCLLLLAILLRLTFPGAFLAIVSPLFRAGNALTGYASSLTTLVKSKTDLGRQRDALLAQNSALTLANQKLEAQIADVEKLLGTAPKAENGIIAGVLARPPQSGYDVLIVAAGSKDGVTAGMHTFGNGGVPLGTVASVTATSARIGLYSAAGVVTDIWVGNARIPAVMTGEGGGAFRATAPKGAKVQAGDIVYASGAGALPIGSVASVDQDASTAEEILYIQGAVNPFSIAWVELLP